MNRKATRYLRAAAILCPGITGLFLSQKTLQAATNTWTGGTDLEWYTAANWSSGIPDVSQDLVIGTGSYTTGLAQYIAGGTAANLTVGARTLSFNSSDLGVLAAGDASTGSLNRFLILKAADTDATANAEIVGIKMTSNAANTLYIGGTSSATGALTVSLSYTGQIKWDIASGKTMVISGTIAGTGGIIKTGNGVLELGKNGGTLQGGAHAFAGGFTLQQGTVIMDEEVPGASVFGSGGLTLSGGSLIGTNLLSIVNNSVTMTGDVSITGTEFTRPIDLAGGIRTVTVGMNVPYTLPGVTEIDSSVFNGSLVKEGPGTLSFFSTNTYTSYNSLTLRGGSVVISAPTALATNTTLVADGGAFYCKSNGYSGTYVYPNVTILPQNVSIASTLNFSPLINAPGLPTSTVYSDLVLYGTVSLTGTVSGIANSGEISVGAGRTVYISADLVGNGTLEKTGTGNLFITSIGSIDPKNFGGTILVSDGTLYGFPLKVVRVRRMLGCAFHQLS